MSPDTAKQNDRRREIIARAIGIQTAIIYHHFPSKQDLFVTCTSNGCDSTIGSP
ncbi:MAG: helix-turn-helix transcriptional regulator [Loktanella sp.]|nr:helix-turn-helix transcriptional regulator [Loktanella sp.]